MFTGAPKGVLRKHFTNSDFHEEYVSGTKHLKASAVPAVFNFLQKPTKAQRKPPKECHLQNAAGHAGVPMITDGKRQAASGCDDEPSGNMPTFQNGTACENSETDCTAT